MMNYRMTPSWYSIYVLYLWRCLFCWRPSLILSKPCQSIRATDASLIITFPLEITYTQGGLDVVISEFTALADSGPREEVI